jgi:hypothetical protein
VCTEIDVEESAPFKPKGGKQADVPAQAVSQEDPPIGGRLAFLHDVDLQLIG